MKKILVALMLCLVSIMSFGQISVGISGTTRNDDATVFYKGIYGRICKIDTTYVICVNDLRSNEVLYVNLGSNLEVTVESLSTLNDALTSLKNKEYISFNDGEKNVIMYKWGGVPYFSDGTAEYVHNYLKNSMMQGMFGGNAQSARIREGDKIIGCLDIAKAFQIAIKNLSK